MTKIFTIIMTGLFLLALPIHADEQGDVYASENIKQPLKLTPFGLKGNYDITGDAKFEKHKLKDQHLRFGLGQAEISAVYYYNPKCEEGANIALGYSSTLLQWKQNPYFDEEHFNTVDLSFAFFSKRLQRWFWQAQATISFDTDHWNFSDYTYYDFTLWGRYSCNENVGYHLGAIVETGMQLDRVYPILGFDWAISPKWKLNLVYPVNVSLVYSWTNQWALSLAGRFFDVRHRVGRDEPLSKALYRYTNTGAEFMIRYEYTSDFWADIHGGYTLGGLLRISNKNNKDPHHFYLKPTGYVGAELAMRF